VKTGYRYVGRGIYSIPEVARLSGVQSRSISRWVHGYRSSAHGVCLEGKPVFKGDFEEDECSNLSFLDLIEIRFVHAFRGYGVSWKTIRTAMEKACELLSETHPFSSKKFLTDGRSILYQVEQECRDTRLINLVNDQYELKKLLDRYLHEGLEFTPDDIASRWWPCGREHDIVIDPVRSFEKPIIASTGIPTGVIYDSFKAESFSAPTVAHWLGITADQVVEAVDFEKSLTG